MKLSQMIIYLSLFVLIVLGIGYQMNEKPFMTVFFIVIIGLILFWVKYPPAFISKVTRFLSQQRHQPASRPSKAKTKKDRPRSKSVPFKVIEGGRDDNETPRYH